MQVLQNSIHDKLQYIKNNFVDPLNKSVYLGDGLSSTGGIFGGTTFIDKLFSGYTDFKAAYSASLATSGTPGPVYIRNLDATTNTYQSVTLTALAANLSGYHAGTTELNLSSFLIPGSALAMQMDKLANMYSLLEGATYDKYKLGQSFQLRNYRVAGGTTIAPAKVRDDATMQLIVDLTGVTTPVDLLPLSGIAGKTSTDLTSSAITAAPASTTLGAPKEFITLTPSATLSSGSITGTLSRSPVLNGVMTVTFKIRGNSQLQLATTDSLSPIYTPNPVNWTQVSWQAPVAPPNTTPGVAASAPTITFKSWYNGIASNTVDIADLKVIYDNEADTIGTIPMLGPKTDIFVVRRLLALYMAITNCYIAMGYFEATGGAFNLVNLCYENMQQLNKNLLSPEMLTVRDSLNANMTAFNANATAINELDAAVTDMKMDLRTRMSLYDTTKTQNAKTRTYMYITLVVFLLIVISTGGIAFTGYDPMTKIFVTGTLWLTAMVVGWIIYRVYRKNVQEYFAAVPQGAAVFELQNYNAALNATNILSNIAAFNVAIFEEADKYLENTVNINVTLRTAKDYGNMNNAISTEITAFKSRQYQINQNINQVSDSRNILQLSNKDNTAKITLFISLMVILAGTVFTLMALENYPTAHILVYIIAAIAVFVAVTLYILDVTGRVRTMGTNMYWAQPNVESL